MCALFVPIWLWRLFVLTSKQLNVLIVLVWTKVQNGMVMKYPNRNIGDGLLNPLSSWINWSVYEEAPKKHFIIRRISRVFPRGM